MLYLYVVIGIFHSVLGHGYLKDPPQRSSLWRFYPDYFPPNYNDNALNCGGRIHQWYVNKGRCGTCGDPFDDIRQHEDGGYYDSGFISRNYTSGSNIIITVSLTSNHGGWFEFKLCPRDLLSRDRFYETLDDCLNDNILQIDGGSTQYEVGQKRGDIEVKVKLPPGLTCTRCILQWKYNTGNSWGCNTRGCCQGCGEQEQFYNCADIGILEHGDKFDSGEIQYKDVIFPKNFPSTPARVKSCEPSSVFRGVPGMKIWCENTCPFCPKSHCLCN